MSEQVIGTARIDIAGDASGVEAAAAKAKKSIADMADSGQAQYSRLSRAEKRRVESLVSQQNAIRDAIARQLELNESLGAGGQALETLVRRAAMSPWSLAAGGALALAMAWKQGRDELKELNRHIVMTGNSLGLTTSHVTAMAVALDRLPGATRGGAVALLTEIAKTGKIASDQMQIVAEVAIQSNQLLGREFADVVGEFAKLADEPTKASAALNREYGYLTLAVYAQIKALEEQGRRQEAASLAQDSWAEATKRNLDQVRSELGFLERNWNAVRDAAAETWDVMKGLGRQATLQEELQSAAEKVVEARKILADAEEGRVVGFQGSGRGQVEHARMAVLRYEALQQAVAQEQANASIAKHQKETSVAQQEALDRWEIQAKRISSNAEKRRKEIEQAKRDAAILGKSQADLASQISAIEERYKDKTRTGGGNAPDAAERTLGSLRQQEAALRAQVDSSDRLTSSQAALVKFEQQIADLKTKKTLSADEKSLLAAEGRLRSQHQTNAALEREAEAKKVLITLDERSAQIAEQMSLARQSTNDQYQRQLDAFGLGDKAMERVQAQRNIYREFERRQEDWAKLAAKAGALESDVYKRVSKEIDDELKRRLAGLENYHTVVDELQRSWNRGATQGLANYSDEAANVFKSVSGFATESFRGMEDAIVEFARTGKLSFSDMTNSIIGDMLRIVTQQSITGPLAGVLGKSISSWFGGGAPAPAGVTPGLDYLHANAKGNVFDSPSLSRYSNGVYNSPQFFEFAKGAGVFAEAGPEAIMPLKRGSDGSLGVRAEMPRMPAAASGIPEINVYLQGVQGQPEVSARRNQNGGIDMNILVKQVSNQLGAEVAAGQGGLSRGLESRFVLTKRLG